MFPQVTSFFSDWPHQSLFSFQEVRHIYDRFADNIFDKDQTCLLKEIGLTNFDNDLQLIETYLIPLPGHH